MMDEAEIREREFEIRQKLAELQEKYKAETWPLLHELSMLDLRKPRRDVTLPDGRVFRYIGPTYDDIVNSSDE